MWSSSHHFIIIAVLCCNSYAFLGRGKLQRLHSSSYIRVFFENGATPKSDRDLSYDAVRNSAKSAVELSSLLLLSQLVSAVTPSKVNAAGYQAAPSAFASNDYLYTAPLLPQSALLNSLPIQDELVAELQAYLESFVQLINPSDAQENQIERNDSILWTNLRINAQRAAGMFIYNKDQLLPDNNTNFNTETAELQRLRRGLSEDYLVQMQQDVLRLVNGSRKSSVSESLRYMRRSLNGLCSVAYMLYPLNRALQDVQTAVSADAEVQKEEKREKKEEKKQEERRRKKVEGNLLSSTSDPIDYSNIPRLDGRATVVLTFQKKANSESSKFQSGAAGGSDRATVTLVVDGINHPLTGGNFVDLCLRGQYNNEVVRFEPFEYDHGIVNRTVLGFSKTGFLEEKTGKKREIPLEVLRDARDKNTVRKAKDKSKEKDKEKEREKDKDQGEGPSLSDVSAKVLENTDEKLCIINSDSNGRFTAVGLARNSPVFTKAVPVLSFATNGAIGMMHDVGDENGASQGFFWVQVRERQTDRERERESRRGSDSVKEKDR